MQKCWGLHCIPRTPNHSHHLFPEPVKWLIFSARMAKRWRFEQDRYHEKGSVKTIQVKVKPNSRVSELEKMEDGSWIAKLKSPPVDGKANQELMVLIARHFGCSKSAVSIKSGASGRMKLVQIDGG